jgi:hypothetical protein
MPRRPDDASIIGMDHTVTSSQNVWFVLGGYRISQSNFRMCGFGSHPRRVAISI